MSNVYCYVIMTNRVEMKTIRRRWRFISLPSMTQVYWSEFIILSTISSRTRNRYAIGLLEVSKWELECRIINKVRKLQHSWISYQLTSWYLVSCNPYNYSCYIVATYFSWKQLQRLQHFEIVVIWFRSSLSSGILYSAKMSQLSIEIEKEIWEEHCVLSFWSLW